ncbi:MAG: RNA polymerase sigma factor [Deltaproteobacteria bacterium]|nr:RNA polymerase sigma factor [Deltaproteobacteria bacterium]
MKSAFLNLPHDGPGRTTVEAGASGRSDDACLDAFQRELDYLLRTLHRLGVEPPDLEDLAQDVFLILRRNWQQHDASRPLRPYLFAIAFRVASSHRRRRWREVPLAIVDRPDPGLYPDGVLEATQARGIVLRVLQSIPLPRRAVLIMHDLDEVPVQEVAASLSIPLFTAYSRLRKARRELRGAILRMQERSAIR